MPVTARQAVVGAWRDSTPTSLAPPSSMSDEGGAADADSVPRGGGEGLGQLCHLLMTGSGDHYEMALPVAHG